VGKIWKCQVGYNGSTNLAYLGRKRCRLEDQKGNQKRGSQGGKKGEVPTRGVDASGDMKREIKPGTMFGARKMERERRGKGWKRS